MQLQPQWKGVLINLKFRSKISLMNKTIIININGIVFHIEEDAYEILRSYMSDVKRHFAYSSDSAEFVTDIENRLAEMFAERLQKDGKQVIILDDVQEVTAQMGTVADFALSEDESEYPREKPGKKLFRDTDDRMLAGVCSGLGHYLEIEARWIRLFFLLITFVGGSGLMVYAILWIVMPEAKTRTDKMSMKGEAINLQNIKKTFDDEVEHVRRGINRVRNEARPALQNMGNSFFDIIKTLLRMTGAVLIFIQGMVLLGLIVALTVVLGVWTTGEVGPLPHLVAAEYRSALAIGLFLTVSIPLIALILVEIRLLFNRKVIGKTGAFFMLIFWLAGLSASAFYGTKTGIDFSEEASFSHISMLQPSSLYHLKLNSEQHLSVQDSLAYNITPSNSGNRTVVNIRHGEFDYENDIDLIIENSDTGKATLTREYSSRGSSFEAALKSAQRIKYGFSQADSSLYFDRSLDIGQNSLFRDQEVNLVLRVPENTKLRIDRNMHRYIKNYNLWDCLSGNQSNKSSSEWIMTAQGLKCFADSTKNRE